MTILARFSINLFSFCLSFILLRPFALRPNNNFLPYTRSCRPKVFDKLIYADRLLRVYNIRSPYSGQLVHYLPSAIFVNFVSVFAPRSNRFHNTNLFHYRKLRTQLLLTILFRHMIAQTKPLYRYSRSYYKILLFCRLQYRISQPFSSPSIFATLLTAVRINSISSRAYFCPFLRYFVKFL